MKKLIFGLPSFLLVCLLLIPGCGDKDDGDTKNYFSYLGDSYNITGAYVYKLIFYNTGGGEEDVYQLYFDNINGSDTTSLYIALLDTTSNEFSGTYNGLDFSSTASRGVFPYLYYAGTCIVYPNYDTYFSGEGGSVKVSVSDYTYTINISDLPLGTYSSSYTFTTLGKVKGSYNGLIPMGVEDYRTKSFSVQQQKRMEVLNRGFLRR